MVPYERIESVQSANVLFHFMKKKKYLTDILKRRGIVPRYCEEDMEYLGIKNVAVLQKCFCDLPIHKLGENIKIKLDDDTKKKLSKEAQNEIYEYNTHPDYYGTYGIAFAKEWCIKQNLQPVHYINKESDYIQEYKTIYKFIWNKDDVEDILCRDIINRLAYFKPLDGKMKRYISDQEIYIYKNFCDEQEWRYIPFEKDLQSVKKGAVVAKKRILDNIREINKELESEEYKDIWLKFKYDDIRYIIVPNRSDRIEIIDYINHILEIPENKKYILISKILVLDEIRKDW